MVLGGWRYGFIGWKIILGGWKIDLLAGNLELFLGIFWLRAKYSLGTLCINEGRGLLSLEGSHSINSNWLASNEYRTSFLLLFGIAHDVEIISIPK